MGSPLLFALIGVCSGCGQNDVADRFKLSVMDHMTRAIDQRDFGARCITIQARGM